MSVIQKKWRIISAIGFMSLSVTAAYAADSAIRQLRQFSNIANIQAAFTQQQILSDGRIERSSGTLQLQKPGKFRWEYRTPYQQFTISDGKQIWFYDVDLNQVIIRKLSQAIGDKPALLLSDPKRAEQFFTIKDLKLSEEGLDWLEATPHQADSSFSNIRLGFKKGLPETIILEDLFGNRTRLQLSNIKTNISIAPSQFTFTPPKDANVMTD